jgi:hypothetical protein
MNGIPICVCHSQISKYFTSQLWNLMLLHNIHKNQLLNLIISQINPVYTHKTYLFTTILSYWNIVHHNLKLKNLETAGMTAPCTSVSKRTLSVLMSLKNLFFPLVWNKFFMLLLPHLLVLYNLHKISVITSGAVTKLSITQFYPSSFTSSLLWPNFVFTWLLHTLNLCPSLLISGQTSKQTMGQAR